MKEENKSKTFKCPDCGSKVLIKTGYCLSCKKKVKKQEDIKKDNIVEIEKDVKIGNFILEKGDKIRILDKIAENYNIKKVYDKILSIIDKILKEADIEDDASKYLIVKDNMVCISGEEEYSGIIADYYGEFRDGYPYINPEIEEALNKMGLYAEWYDPGTVCIGEQ